MALCLLPPPHGPLPQYSIITLLVVCCWDCVSLFWVGVLLPREWRAMASLQNKETPTRTGGVHFPEHAHMYRKAYKAAVRFPYRRPHGPCMAYGCPAKGGNRTAIADHR